MKVLFIGGTGFISTAVSKLTVEKGFELFHLNRGTRRVELEGVTTIHADIDDIDRVKQILKDHSFDVVVNWIVFTPEQMQRDIELFSGKVKQYIFISSASCYQKPPKNPVITEKTPLENPYWDYSQHKIACENILLKAFREHQFPGTIVRPSFTYDKYIPVAVGGFGCFTFAKRILQGKPIISHGDGTSLWTNTHAEDFAKGFIGLLGNERAIGEDFHITSDELLTWDQIYTSVANALGKEISLVHIPSDMICKIEPSLIGPLFGDKSWSAIFDNNKIKKIVPDFKASIPFFEGIQRTIDWYNEDEKRKLVDLEVDNMMDNILKQWKK